MRGGDVAPVLPGVARDVHEAVVATGPEETLLQRGFGDGEDRVVHLDAGVIARDRTAGPLLLCFVVSREITADWLPRFAAIGRLEEDVRAVIDGLRIVRRNEDGSGPLEAILQVRRIVAGGV